MLRSVKYRSRYSFLMIFRPQKSPLKTQNSQFKIPKVPPLEKNRVDFCRNLSFGKTGKNGIFERFNVCWLSKVALLECVFGSRREFVSKNASFEEDFISFFTNCLPYISSPLGGIRGGLYFRVFESRREFDSKNAILRGINIIFLH